MRQSQTQIPEASLPKQYLGMHAQSPPNSLTVLLLTFLFVVLLPALPFLDSIFRRRAQHEHTANTSQRPTQPSSKHASTAPQDDMSPPIRNSRPSHSTNDITTNGPARPRRRRLSTRANISNTPSTRPLSGDEPLVGPHGEVADLSGELFETPGFLEVYRRRHNIRVPPEPLQLPTVPPVPVLPVQSALPIRILSRTRTTRTRSRSNSQMIVGHPPSTSPSPLARRRNASLRRHAEQRLDQPHRNSTGARNGQQQGRQYRRSAFTEVLEEPTAAEFAMHILRGGGVEVRPQARRNGMHYQHEQVNSHASDDDITDRMTSLPNGHTSPVTTLTTSSGSSSSNTANRPIATRHGEFSGGPATTGTITPAGPTAHVLVDEDEGEYVAITEFYTRLTPPEESPRPAPPAPRRASVRPAASAQTSRPARRAVNGTRTRTNTNSYTDAEPAANGQRSHAAAASGPVLMNDRDRRIYPRRQAVYDSFGADEAWLQRQLVRAAADTPAGRAAARARGEEVRGVRDERGREGDRDGERESRGAGWGVRDRMEREHEDGGE